MKRRRIPHWLLSGLFWGISGLIPLGWLWLLRPGPAAGKAQPAGVAWLSLPVELVARDDPARGWSHLAVGQPPPPLAADPDSSLQQRPQLNADPAPARFRVHGTVGSGAAMVYFIFDTEAGRWIRLAAGEADPESGLLLLPTAAAAHPGPFLRDPLSGKTYPLEVPL
jgi:hypothetical protein